MPHKQQHLETDERMKLEEELGGALLRQALQTAAEQGTDHSLLRTFQGPLNRFSDEWRERATEDLRALFKARLQAYQRTKKEESADQLAPTSTGYWD